MSKLAELVDEGPNFRRKGDMVYYVVGDIERCMSIHTLILWHRGAERIINDWSRQNGEVKPFRRRKDD